MPVTRKMSLISGLFITDTSMKPAKRPKCAKGYHVSKNAYTLVYTLQDHQNAGEENHPTLKN